MNNRIKELRKTLKLTQTDFGARIGIKGNTVTGWESGRREVSDAVILSICREFGVSEAWLRYGEGEMFVSTDKGVISSLTEEYGLDTLDQKIVECYLNLSPIQRKVIKDYLMTLVDAVRSDDNTGKKNTAAARSGDRMDVLSVSAEEEEAALPPPSDNVNI